MSSPPILNWGLVVALPMRVQRTRYSPAASGEVVDGNVNAFEWEGPLSSWSFQPTKETEPEPVLCSSTQSSLFAPHWPELPLSATSEMTTVHEVRPATLRSRRFR